MPHQDLPVFDDRSADFRKPSVFPFVVDVVHQPFQAQLQLPVIDGLHQVFEAAQLQGGLGVVEHRVGGEEDPFGAGIVLPHPAEELQPVFNGHFNIADQDIHGLRLEPFLCLQRGIGCQHLRRAQGFPVHPGQDAVQHTLLIVNQQQYHLQFPPFCC